MYLLAVDYSQIELRVMAHVSDDDGLKQAFLEGQDIHRATAAAVNGIAPEDVTYEQRSFAKRVNFGLMYGMGAFRLARDSNLTLAEAEAFIRTYFERFPGVKRYMDDVEKSAREHGYVQTLMGRKRFFPQLASGSTGQRAQGEMRAAINMPIQGTAADILKLAMIKLHAALKERDEVARMILQVHDELVLEVPQDALEETTQLVVETMQDAYPLEVPVVANASYGVNWLDMTDL
jgi:DNA polymerase-1